MMNTDTVVQEVPARTNRTPFIIAAAVVGLCCLCLILGIVGYLAYINIASVETQVAPPFDATVEAIPEDGLDIGQPPEGGLGNDILKNDTWNVIASSAIERGCDRPIGASSTIEVLQEPEDGVWVEEWTVVCGSGDSYSYEVEYILDDTGATFNIRSLP